MAAHIVLDSCQRVCRLAQHVTINEQAIHQLAESLSEADLQRITSPGSFDADLHYVDLSSPQGQATTVQYLLVVDALNFCFWPEPGLEYEHLARGVKAALLADPGCLDAQQLSKVSEGDVQRMFEWPRPVPGLSERTRLLREVGVGLLQRYNGSAAELVRAAEGSAVKLVQLVVEAFPGFRDHCVYQGHQVFLYKRAQIFVGDVYGAFGGQGLGAFADIDQITMFADYRVPVVLKGLGVLAYAQALDTKVANQEQLAPGSEEEVEIRASTICAVEKLRHAIHKRLPAGSPPPLAVPLDWFLWETGEAKRATDPPHHRTLTVYY